MMMGFGMLGLVFMLLFWLGLILLAVWLARALFNNDRFLHSKPDHGASPKEILDQRYARGEINREEYELMKRDIS